MTGNVFRRTVDELRHWFRSDWTFDQVAAHWDATEDYDEQNSKTVSYFRRFVDGLRLANLVDDGRVLDICARTGNGTLYFAQHGKIRSGVCAEVSQKFHQIGQQRLREAGVRNVEWIQLKDYKLPFEHNEFDTILCFETVEHFSEPERLVAELSRVIKPGGVMILTTPNVLWEPIHAICAITGLHHSEGPHRFVRYARLIEMINGSGFKIDKSETNVLVPGGPKLLIKVGDWIEAHTKNWLMPVIGLRRTIVCTKR